jgi:hypothetical protein
MSKRSQRLFNKIGASMYGRQGTTRTDAARAQRGFLKKMLLKKHGPKDHS